MYSWFGNRLIENPRMRVTAAETWEFCLHGLGGCQRLYATEPQTRSRSSIRIALPRSTL